MDEPKARALLREERLRTEQLLKDVDERFGSDKVAANEPGDMFDSAEPLTTQGTDASVMEELNDHLAAIRRAEGRLEAGTYGYSVRSGLPIPDERLEADPAAELTVEEARELD